MGTSDAFMNLSQAANKGWGESMRMKEKVVVITGATGEIGTAMTQRFLAEGASVCLTGRSADKLADINESVGAGAKLTTA